MASLEKSRRILLKRADTAKLRESIKKARVRIVANAEEIKQLRRSK